MAVRVTLKLLLSFMPILFLFSFRLCFLRLFCVSKPTVLANPDFTRATQGNVFYGMTQRSTATITNGHVTIDFRNRKLADQFKSITTMLSELVLSIKE